MTPDTDRVAVSVPGPAQTVASDEELVAAAQRDDPRAFEALVRRHYRKVFALVVKLVGTGETAEGLVLEAFALAYRDVGRFSGRSSFFTWLYRIALNLCLRHLEHRARRREETCSLAALERLACTTGADVTLGEVLLRAQRETLLRCLKRLSEPQRIALLLFYLEGHTYVEVSAAMQLPINTVKSHVHRGTIRMRQELANSDLVLGDAGEDTE